MTEKDVEAALKENSLGSGFKPNQEQKKEMNFIQTYTEPESGRFAAWIKDQGSLGLWTSKGAAMNGDENYIRRFLSEDDIAKAKKSIEKVKTKSNESE